MVTNLTTHDLFYCATEIGELEGIFKTKNKYAPTFAVNM